MVTGMDIRAIIEAYLHVMWGSASGQYGIHVAVLHWLVAAALTVVAVKTMISDTRRILADRR